MRQFIIDKLSELTDEEKELISGSDLNRALYTSSTKQGSELIVDDLLLHERGELIAIRPNTRFVDFEMHSHTYIELLYVIKGKVRSYYPDGEIELEAGNLLVLNRHMHHSLSKTDDKTLAVNIILTNEFVEGLIRKFDNDSRPFAFLSESLRASGSAACYVYDVNGNMPVENLLESIIYTVCRRNGVFHRADDSEEVSEEYLRIENDFLTDELALVLSILSATPGALVHDYHENNVQSDIYDKVMEYIRTEYKTATLSDLASRLYLSTGYLSRWISTNIGTTFRELLMDQRFSVAERLILTTDRSIGSIASEIGYDNRSFFHREFIRRYKTSPLRMRKMSYKNIGNKK